MELQYFPKVIQVVPFKDFTVDVYFDDGKIVLFDIKPFLKQGIFRKLSDINIFMDTCTVLNHTLAWDIAGGRDEENCIDIDPENLHELAQTTERIA